MQEALKEAKKAFSEEEVPVGAVIVHNQRIIARAYNMTEKLNDVTAHAEMLAITAATTAMGGKYLQDCTLYVSLEPCPMCAGALSWSKISRIVFAASDPKRGYSLFSHALLHSKTEVQQGLYNDESVALIRDFFQRKR